MMLTGRYINKSLAKRRIDEEMESDISFMKVRNSKGPSTVPCGTPDKTSDQSEASPSTTTRWDLLVRKFSNHFKREPRIP